MSLISNKKYTLHQNLKKKEATKNLVPQYSTWRCGGRCLRQVDYNTLKINLNLHIKLVRPNLRWHSSNYAKAWHQQLPIAPSYNRSHKVGKSKKGMPGYMRKHSLTISSKISPTSPMTGFSLRKRFSFSLKLPWISIISSRFENKRDIWSSGRIPLSFMGRQNTRSSTFKFRTCVRSVWKSSAWDQEHIHEDMSLP